jgi:hypothetical protein
MKWSTVLPVVAGVASGVLAVLVTSRFTEARHGEKAVATKNAKPSSDVDEKLRRRIERLEARQERQLPGIVTRGGPHPDEEDESDPAKSRPEPRSPDDPRPSATEYFSKKLDEHKKEAIDPEWAPTAQKALGLDVERLVEQKKLPVRVLSVHCATVSCTVELEWPSFSEATRTYVEFVHSTEYSKPCSRGLVLPEAARPDEQYRATLLLGCEEDRTGPTG